MSLITPDRRIVLPHRWMTRRRAMLSLIPLIGQIRRRSSYLVSEDFEGSGAPDGWVTQSGTPNYDYSFLPVQGAEMLSCPDGTGVYKNFANSIATCWAFAWIRRLSTPTVTDFTILGLLDSAGVSLVSVRTRNTSNGWRLWTGNSAVGTTNFGTNGTNVAIWLSYTAGTGGNALTSIYLSATETRPASPALSHSTGTGTTNAERVLCNASGAQIIFDKVRVSASPIGSNPT